MKAEDRQRSLTTRNKDATRSMSGIATRTLGAIGRYERGSWPYYERNKDATNLSAVSFDDLGKQKKIQQSDPLTRMEVFCPLNGGHLAAFLGSKRPNQSSSCR